MKNKLKKVFKGKNLYYLLLFLVCTLLLHSYFWSGTSFPAGDDTPFHLSNIKALSSSFDFLQLKILPSPIVPDIANNLGYGIGLFYPRLPHLIASYITYGLSIFGGGEILGLKITHFLTLFLSAVMMYKFVFSVWKKEKTAFFSALFYITSSYMVSDIIIRDAFAECMVFLFLPMIFWGLYELFYGSKKKFYPLFIIGYVGMLNSHLVVSIFLTGAVGIYLLFHLLKIFKWENLKHLLASAVLIIILFLPTVVPMIEHKTNGSYAVFQESIMTTPELVETCAVYPLSMLIPFYKWENIHFFITITVLILCTVVYKRRKMIIKSEGEKKLVYSLFLMTIIFFILTTKLTPWQYAPNFLLMIQFPWRLEIVVIFATSIIAGLYFLLPPNKNQKIIERTIIIITISFGLVASIPLHRFISPDFLTTKKVSEYGMGWSSEYLPIKTLENAKHYLYQENSIVIIKGNAKIKDVINDMPNYNFNIELSEKVTIEIPKLFYYGYQIVLEDKNEKKVLSYVENKNGLIEVDIPKSGKVLITYPGTKSFQVTKKIRTTTITIIIILTTIYYIRKKRNPSTKLESKIK